MKKTIIILITLIIFLSISGLVESNYCHYLTTTPPFGSSKDYIKTNTFCRLNSLPGIAGSALIVGPIKDLFNSENNEYPFYESNQINKNSLPSGYYNTEGYVIKINGCMCPLGANCNCKPGPLSITISRNSNLIDAYPYGDSELEIMVKEPKDFEIDQRYRFSISLINNGSNASSTIELVDYKKIK